jgi:uncharacterized membrane protein YtjA (UPF0391 family)
MLRWPLIFLALAINAGALGFTGIAEGAGTTAILLFGLFSMLFIFSLFVRRIVKKIVRLNIQ